MVCGNTAVVTLSPTRATVKLSWHLLRDNHVTIAVIAMGVSFHMRSASLIYHKNIWNDKCSTSLPDSRTSQDNIME